MITKWKSFQKTAKNFEKSMKSFANTLRWSNPLNPLFSLLSKKTSQSIVLLSIWMKPSSITMKLKITILCDLALTNSCESLKIILSWSFLQRQSKNTRIGFLIRSILTDSLNIGFIDLIVLTLTKCTLRI